ncbi:MAG: hypothetical protein H3C30_13920 [Candidatus Hydrogenedentes bacterium]|nr:hypothetical protein [Candidatus Hydrogenedentota bacterium]
MPVYERSYRNYDGAMRHQFRWWIVLEQEFRVLSRSKIFKFLVILAAIQVLVRLLQVVAYDVVIQDPNHPMAAILSQVDGIVVKSSTFFDFVRLQSPVMFIMLLFAGSGMICNDFRNNLMEIYFSKPMRWYDYVVGKTAALILLGLCVTALPAVLLIAQHNLLLPNWALFQESLNWAAASLGFSLALVVPTALAILACSALLPGQNYAAITVFMLLIANSTMAGLLAGALRDRNYLILSFPMAIHRLGQFFFEDRSLIFDLDWKWAFALVFAVSFVSLLIVMRRARRSEMAA